MTAASSLLLPPRAGRRAGIAATLLVHGLLLLGWTMTRKAPSITSNPPRTTVQWIRLPAPATPQPRRHEAHPLPIHPRTAALPGAIAVPSPSTTAAPAASGASPTAVTAAGPAADAPAAPAPPAQSAGAALLERARRDAGAVDRALRKENYPYIVAPLDSPQIRMRDGIAAAAHMAPGMDELVNNTGDGARRTRVVTGGSTYCMTERSPATSIDTIEKHGKWRQTNCPGHESTANGQAWRTARD
ncbi:MAG: hypothetical protein JF619_18690 [Massilia sp.]|nr:hypothetical protein [Massilia sp.]